MKLADAILLAFILILVWSLYRAQKDSGFTFDLFDLLMDAGKLSKVSTAFMVTLSVTSWVMIRLTIDGKLTEGYFTGYGLMWVAPLIAKLFAAPPPAGTTTTDTSSKTVIQTGDKA